MPQAKAAVWAGDNAPAGGHVIQDNAIARQPYFAYLQGLRAGSAVATKAGTDAEHLVKQAVLRLLEEAVGLPVLPGSVVNELSKEQRLNMGNVSVANESSSGPERSAVEGPAVPLDL